MKIERDAIRFYGKDGGQVNCHYYLLNPFLIPSCWWARVKNFVHGLRSGIRLERKT